MEAYKLFRRRKNGTFGSLFINRKAPIKFYSWVQAETHPTKGFAVRTGWHCLAKPKAPHLSTKGRVWCRVQIAQPITTINRPNHQGGKWYLAHWMRIVEVMA